MPSIGQECRKFKRFATEFMKINGKLMFASTVDIIDISLGGIALQTNKTLKIDTEYMLRVETKGRSISVKGLVVWSTPSGSRQTAEGEIAPLYSVGMRFNDLNTEKINDLIEFIESHKLELEAVKLHSMSGLRVNMRYHLATNGESLLTCPQDFLVKEISLRDVLIETDHAFELDQELPMLIFLPGESEISLTGRIASCIPIKTAEPKQVAIGIEFLNMKKENAEKLTGFIRMLSQHNSSPAEFY